MCESNGVNERVLMGHLRGMCENVCQVGQLCRSPGVEGETLKKKKKRFPVSGLLMRDKVS